MDNSVYKKSVSKDGYLREVTALYNSSKQEVKLTYCVVGYDHSKRVKLFDMTISNAHNELYRAIGKAFTELNSYLESVKITTKDVTDIFEKTGFTKHTIK